MLTLALLQKGLNSSRPAKNLGSRSTEITSPNPVISVVNDLFCVDGLQEAYDTCLSLLLEFLL